MMEEDDDYRVIEITYTVGIGLVGCKRTRTIEVEASATDGEIDDLIIEDAMQLIDITWERPE